MLCCFVVEFVFVCQFDKGNYDIKSQSPHEPACLLKHWLRMLAEPIIPEALYVQVG